MPCGISARASVARVLGGDADIGLEKHFGTLNGADGRTDGRTDGQTSTTPPPGGANATGNERGSARTLARSLVSGALSSSVGDRRSCEIPSPPHQ